MQKKRGLKGRTINGLLWSFGDLAGNQGMQFLIQIILARLLLPEHFGLIGIVLIFVALSNSLVDSGFTQALIRERKPTQVDYSTVFHFNLAMSLVLYGCIYLTAPAIGAFFGEEQLTLFIRVMAISIIIKSFELVPRAILSKEIDFKTQATVNVIASLFSGLIAIFMAFSGFGIWSLIVRLLVMNASQSILFFVMKKWLPSWTFSFRSFRRLYHFGWKLLVSGLIDTLGQNLFAVLIGRNYSAGQLGYYMNASKFSDVVTQSLTAAIQRVTYPVLSRIQDEDERLKDNYRTLVKLSAFLIFPMMLGLAAIAEPMVRIVFGSQWEPMTIYFQLLCIAGMLYPIHALNLNILQVKGRSDIFLYLEVGKFSMTLGLVFLAIWLDLGMIGLVALIVVDSYSALLLNMYFSGKEIDYTVRRQLEDLFPSFLLAAGMGTLTYVVGHLLDSADSLTLIIQVIIGMGCYIGMAKWTTREEFHILWKLLLPIMKKWRLARLG